MGEIPEREEIAAIVRRYASGDDHAFDELYLRYRDTMVRVASRIIARQHLRDAFCDAELVVDKAFIDLRTARSRGDLGKIGNGEQLLGLLELYVTREVGHERVRSQANKRGGPNPTQVPLDQCGPDVLESLVSHGDSVEELFFEREEFERLHDLLDDPVQQEILSMRYEDYSIEDICSRLKRSRSSLNRDVLEIRRVYERSKARRP